MLPFLKQIEFLSDTQIAHTKKMLKEKLKNNICVSMYVYMDK